jgi:hypothetical protein
MSASEPDGLIAQLLTNEAVARGGRVALVEYEVNHGEDGVEALSHLDRRGHLEAEVALANRPLRTDEPLRDRRFLVQEGPRDLPRAEATHGTQRERNARFGRQFGMAAEEDQRELVIGERMVAALESMRCFGVRECRGSALAADQIDGPVTRCLNEPRRRVLGDAVMRPVLECFDKGVLSGIVRKVDAIGAQDARQSGDDSAGLATEEVLGFRRGAGYPMCWTSRTSMLPQSRCGWSLQ